MPCTSTWCVPAKQPVFWIPSWKGWLLIRKKFSRLIFGSIGGAIYTFFYMWKRSKKMQMAMDRLFLKIPIFGPVIEKATVARWTRTLSTMFAAGVPLVEALDSVGGASGKQVAGEAHTQ